MPSSYVFAVTAPEGTLHARFLLEPDRRYAPPDVVIERGPVPAGEPDVLTVTAMKLTTEAEFCVLAARAATKCASVPRDPTARLLNVLIPF